MFGSVRQLLLWVQITVSLTYLPFFYTHQRERQRRSDCCHVKVVVCNYCFCCIYLTCHYVLREESDKAQLSVAPPSGCNLIWKNPPLPINTTNQSQGVCLRSVNHSGSPPPPGRCSICSHLVRYIQVQTVNNAGEQTTTIEQKHAPPSPTSQKK